MELPTEQERGNAFEVFAEALLATQLKYQADEVWPDKMVPAAIRKKLLLPEKDMGVDGVFQTLSGNFFVQRLQLDQQSFSFGGQFYNAVSLIHRLHFLIVGESSLSRFAEIINGDHCNVY